MKYTAREFGHPFLRSVIAYSVKLLYGIIADFL